LSVAGCALKASNREGFPKNCPEECRMSPDRFGSGGLKVFVVY
jgi:hypothetical protein